MILTDDYYLFVSYYYIVQNHWVREAVNENYYLLDSVGGLFGYFFGVGGGWVKVEIGVCWL